MNNFGNLDSDLSALAVPNTVITSLDLEPAHNTYGISSIQTSQAGGFEFNSQTVPPDQFQVVASQLGAASRVVTAVSFDGSGQVFVLSYGWQSDTTTIYEAKVAPATLDTIGAEATALAAAGYIITALGGNPTNGFFLVGTRVQRRLYGPAPHGGNPGDWTRSDPALQQRRCCRRVPLQRNFRHLDLDRRAVGVICCGPPLTGFDLADISQPWVPWVVWGRAPSPVRAERAVRLGSLVLSKLNLGLYSEIRC